MKKLILLPILLIVGCEEILESIKEGCTTTTSCNYDSAATKDDGSCVAPQGCNEWCVGDTLSAQEFDCADVCGGTAVLDDCGICDGIDGYVAGSCYDCADTPNGDAVLDCTGICEGNATEDYCNACISQIFDCAGVCDGNSVVDCAGVCDGNGEVDYCNACESQIFDCAGVCDGNSVVDNCDTCDSDSTNDCITDAENCVGNLHEKMWWNWENTGFDESTCACDGVPSEYIYIWGKCVNPAIGQDDFYQVTQGAVKGDTIPPTIGHLYNVTGIQLAIGTLTGKIPPEIGNMTNLKRLDLGGQNLTGGIPLELFNLSNLEELLLNDNKLGCYDYDFECLDNYGEEWPGLQAANDCCITHCDETDECSGQIPSEIGNLTNLVQLKLESNPFSGLLPDSICNLDIVTSYNNGWQFTIGNNQICEPYPPSASCENPEYETFQECNSADLEWVDTECIIRPAGVGDQDTRNCEIPEVPIAPIPPNLYYDIIEHESAPDSLLFYWSINDIYTLPYKLYLSNEMFEIDEVIYALNEWTITDTSIKIPAPISIGQWYYILEVQNDWTLTSLSNAQTVYISNCIEGEIGLWGECYSIDNTTELILDDRGLQGIIPPSIGQLSNLTEVKLHKNKLTGEIPSEMGNLINLQYLDLHDNQLTGSIPNLSHFITRLDLSKNQLTAFNNILYTMTNLEYLYLQNNNISGEIPPEIVNLTNLNQLNLGGNQLTGAIPPEIGLMTNLGRLHLNDNQLTGEIPPEIGNLTDLGQLDLSGNQLTGAIPPEIANITCVDVLSLNNNQLTGSIPIEIWNINCARFFSLNNNELTGSIPEEIDISYKGSFNLNGNQLTGVIPESLCPTWLGATWKSVKDNQFCPPYLDCGDNPATPIQVEGPITSEEDQDTSNCP